MQPLIRLNGVTKIFGKGGPTVHNLLTQGASREEIQHRTGSTVGVNQVTLEIGAGELFVIMGLSGSGKSTLLRCVNRLIEPTWGEITIDGIDVTSLDQHGLLQFRRQKTAMVFQRFALFPHRSVEENVAFGLELQGIPLSERTAIAHQQLAIVGLEEWATRFPDELSGGMQQRVGLARALANDPAILMMDEAFSALDPLIREDMQDELLRLQRQLKKTILFITHDLNEALKLGDRIALMKDGELVQVGTPEEIVTSPANDYVARFLKGVDVSKVLTAADIMKRPSPILRLYDGPTVALRRLDDAGLSSGYVVDNGRLCGLVTGECLSAMAKAHEKTLVSATYEETVTISKETLLDELVTLCVTTRYPIAVVDEEQTLCGLIMKSTILEALATQGGDAHAS